MIITIKPFDQMTVSELRAELSMWDRSLGLRNRFGSGFGTGLRVAQECRDACAAMLARREREATGRAA